MKPYAASNPYYQRINNMQEDYNRPAQYEERQHLREEPQFLPSHRSRGNYQDHQFYGGGQAMSEAPDPTLQDEDYYYEGATDDTTPYSPPYM